MGALNGWGYGIEFFRALNFQILEPEIWAKSLFLRNFRDSPAPPSHQKIVSRTRRFTKPIFLLNSEVSP